ncbi:MAG: hypothetical protein PHV11_02325 [Candidatus Bipolaricaulis sp.]|nr:hypothetical protein [Candidatus Bipolaricaulis sp.]
MSCANAGPRPRRFMLLFVALAAAGCLSGSVVSIPSEIARFAAGAALAAGTVVWAARRLGASGGWLGIVLAAAGIAGVLAGPWSALRLASLAVWAGGIGRILGTPEERRLLSGPMCAALALAILDLVPSLRLLAMQTSAGLSSVLLAPLGGGSFSGASGGCVALAALVVCLAAWSRHDVERKRKIVALLVLVLLFLGQGFAQWGTAAPGMRTASSGVAFLLGALVLAAAASGPTAASFEERARRRSDVLLAALAVVCTLVPVSLATVESLCDAFRSPQRVLLLDVAMLADHRLPADKPLGQAFTGASFGSLPLYLRAYGHDCSVATTVDAGLPSQADVVVVINPGRPFTSEERDSLLAFVGEGGGLLALGDHTDIGGLMASLNGLLVPAGLRLLFDSAVLGHGDWCGSLSLPYPESVIFRDDDVPVSIGASVSGGAWWSGSRPLMVGTDAFSDPGDRDNGQAYLGNLAFDRGEHHGDVLLGVERRLGRGRIALFGDTSIFQNLSLASSSGYVDRLVRHLAGGPGVPPMLLLAFGSLGVAFLVVCARSAGGPILLFAAAFLFAVGLAVADLLVSRVAAIEWPGGSAIGVIDLRHANPVDRQALATSGIDALAAAVARGGALPLVWDRPRMPDPLQAGDLWISVAATRPFSSADVEALRAAAERGARLVVGARWPYSAAAAPLLNPLGAEVTNVPLGAVRPSVDGLDEVPELGSAWILRVGPAWAALGHASVGEGAYPVVAERSLGRGWIAIVADTAIFTNAALEGRGYAFVENVRFVERLLRGEVTP